MFQTWLKFYINLWRDPFILHSTKDHTQHDPCVKKESLFNSLRRRPVSSEHTVDADIVDLKEIIFFVLVFSFLFLFSFCFSASVVTVECVVGA